MKDLNKNILRSFLVVSYIIVIALIIYGVSSVYGYLNTGADRSNMLHTELKKIDQYSPKVNWTSLKNEGRPIDTENLKAIEDDYLDAWYVRHVAYKTNTKTGVADFYTDSARKNIYDLIDLNKTQDISIESTTLQHNLTIEFFSEDGQLATLTDRNVTEYKRILKENQIVLETTEKSTYKIVLLLEDGFWRIRHIVKQSAEDFKPQNRYITNDNFKIKGINYYPKDTPWDMFGHKFSKDTISKDLKIIKDAGLNTIRIFVQYDDFGAAKVNSNKIQKLINTLDAAEENDLKVVVTLFDFYGDYSVLNWTLNQRHAENIIEALKDHKALLAWDIKNEPNLDFESRGKTNVIAWLNAMIHLVKSIDTEHSITIGWSDIKSASLLQDKVDFVSFHYYDDLEHLDASIKKLKKDIPNKTLVMGEFGMSSYDGFWKPFGNSEEDQAEYHKKAQHIISNNDLEFMSWTLYDFTEVPENVVGNTPWRQHLQKHFGFINTKGIKKPAFRYLNSSE